jgi:hypothetical protein
MGGGGCACVVLVLCVVIFIVEIGIVSDAVNRRTHICMHHEM